MCWDHVVHDTTLRVAPWPFGDARLFEWDGIETFQHVQDEMKAFSQNTLGLGRLVPAQLVTLPRVGTYGRAGVSGLLHRLARSGVVMKL